MNKFTIIICAHNSSSKIKRAIEAILVQNKYSELVQEFIIVDNNSADDTK